jgi:hypothetical protein
MMHTIKWRSTVVLSALGLSACQERDLLSTELANARMVPIVWDTSATAAASDSLQAPPNACALRLRDSLTGSEYQIQRRSATRTNPDAPAGTAPVWAQRGDYAKILPGPNKSRPSVYVRIECGTWKVEGLVPAKPPRATP